MISTLEQDKCPKCSAPINSHTQTKIGEKISPEEGDISICVKCHAVLEFTEDLTLKLADISTLPAEIVEHLNMYII